MKAVVAIITCIGFMLKTASSSAKAINPAALKTVGEVSFVLSSFFCLVLLVLAIHGSPHYIEWGRRRDLNPGPRGPQPRALPAELRRPRIPHLSQRPQPVIARWGSC